MNTLCGINIEVNDGGNIMNKLSDKLRTLGLIDHLDRVVVLMVADRSIVIDGNIYMFDTGGI